MTPINAETKKIARGIIVSAKTWTKNRATGLGLKHSTGERLHDAAMMNLKYNFPCLYSTVNEVLGIQALSSTEFHKKYPERQP